MQYLSKLHTHKPVGPDGMHAQILSWLADVTVKMFPIVFE